jgi:DNA-directed RNA polymerase subunit RPC12/RpoP
MNHTNARHCLLPLVAKYPTGSRWHQPHWVSQTDCSKCGQPCWIPGGADEAVKKGEAVCQHCSSGDLFL